MKKIINFRIIFFMLCIAPWLLQSCATASSRSSTTYSKRSPLRVYVFNCGEISVKDISLFAPGTGPGVGKRLIDSCYVIEHPQGNLLWDSGLNDTIANNKDGISVNNGNFHMSVSKPFIEQLKEIGMTPADMKFIAFSHFHADHVGNANAFAGRRATLLIQNEEYDAAFGPNPEQYRFDPSSYDQLRQNPVIKLSGDYDVFGDGSVIIKRTIGHTPGHQSLFLNLPWSGPVVLSGDLYHFTDNRTHQRVPSFNFDKEATIQSMTAMENFVREKNAQVWIQHDYEQSQTLRHAPLYYE